GGTAAGGHDGGVQLPHRQPRSRRLARPGHVRPPTLRGARGPTSALLRRRAALLPRRVARPDDARGDRAPRRRRVARARPRSRRHRMGAGARPQSGAALRHLLTATSSGSVLRNGYSAARRNFTSVTSSLTGTKVASTSRAAWMSSGEQSSSWL